MTRWINYFLVFGAFFMVVMAGDSKKKLEDGETCRSVWNKVRMVRFGQAEDARTIQKLLDADCIFVNEPEILEEQYHYKIMLKYTTYYSATYLCFSTPQNFVLGASTMVVITADSTKKVDLRYPCASLWDNILKSLPNRHEDTRAVQNALNAGCVFINGLQLCEGKYKYQIMLTNTKEYLVTYKSFTAPQYFRR